jgi:hypothetical protein
MSLGFRTEKGVLTTADIENDLARPEIVRREAFAEIAIAIYTE